MRDEDIEGTYAELDLGRMLYQSAIEFRFVVTSGQKGDDFDIEIILNDGIIVCADAKCKIESTNFSEKTVLNSLQHAAHAISGPSTKHYFCEGATALASRAIEREKPSYKCGKQLFARNRPSRIG